MVKSTNKVPLFAQNISNPQMNFRIVWLQDKGMFQACLRGLMTSQLTQEVGLESMQIGIFRVQVDQSNQGLKIGVDEVEVPKLFLNNLQQIHYLRDR